MDTKPLKVFSMVHGKPSPEPHRYSGIGKTKQLWKLENLAVWKEFLESCGCRSLEVKKI
jgi:hypothetical protein